MYVENNEINCGKRTFENSNSYEKKKQTVRVAKLYAKKYSQWTKTEYV